MVTALDRHLADKRKSFYNEAMAAADEADDIAKKGKGSGVTAKSTQKVTVDISRRIRRALESLEKSVEAVRKLKAQEQKITIHLPKMVLGQTEIEVFANKIMNVRPLSGINVAADTPLPESPRDPDET